jgi:hypothetical protein
MIITTKYKVGQELYFISKYSNKIECAPVYKLEATVGDITEKPEEATTVVRYFFHLNFNREVEIVREDSCYLTKQELIESL